MLNTSLAAWMDVGLNKSNYLFYQWSVILFPEVCVMVLETVRSG